MKMIRGLTIFCLLVLAGCSASRPDITQVSDEDAGMRAAIEEARSTLDQFWAHRTRYGPRFDGLLKVYFTQPGSEGGEHMWVQVTAQTPERISGILLSHPGRLRNVKEGDVVEFPPSRVTDWLYVENGEARGAYTVQLLRSRMTPEERRAHDAGYPFRFE